jgi:thymidylate synthase
MAWGFPLFTHKRMAVKAFKVELEGFIKGITDKSWYQARGCNIWNEWCNPKKVKYANDEDTKSKMLAENDLGKIYGYQWRNFNSQGIDQLKHIVETLKTNKSDRRLLCSAWNPVQLDEQALPPCHVMWHVFALEDTLHLCWLQRSVDTCLGLPANVMSYALLLHLLCLETGLKPGKVTGFLSNCHIYVNQIEGAREALTRPLHPFPTVVTDFKTIYDWEAKKTVFINYKHSGKLLYPIAV